MWDSIDGLPGYLKDYQKAGVSFIVHQRKVLLGDAPGLGKTLQALAAVDYLGDYPCVVVCPAHLRFVWQEQIAKWFPGLTTHLIGLPPPGSPANFTITSYEGLSRYQDYLKGLQPRAVIVDESHRVKNLRAHRTRHVKALVEGVDTRILLSGTAILNRPTELISQLEIIDRMQEFGSRRAFVHRYGTGYHLDELYRKLTTTCYLRREKKDVLKELPAKQRVVVPLPIDNREEYELAERDLIAWLRSQDLHERIPAALRAEHLVRLGALKKLAALGKYPAIREWVDDALEGGKLVLFANHRDIAQRLACDYDAPLIIGGMNDKERKDAVDRFQTDPDTLLLVANIRAGSEGLTLTASHRVAFVELDWGPGPHEQAEDRVHRIGQHEPVTAYYLVAAETIEEKLMYLIDSKRRIMQQTLSGQGTDDEIPLLDQLVMQLRGATNG